MFQDESDECEKLHMAMPYRQHLLYQWLIHSILSCRDELYHSLQHRRVAVSYFSHLSY